MPAFWGIKGLSQNGDNAEGRVVGGIVVRAWSINERKTIKVIIKLIKSFLKHELNFSHRNNNCLKTLPYVNKKNIF